MYFYKSGKRWSIYNQKYNSEYDYNLSNHIRHNVVQDKKNLQKQQKIINKNLKKLKRQEPITNQILDNLYENKDLIGIGLLCFSIGTLINKNNK